MNITESLLEADFLKNSVKTKNQLQILYSQSFVTFLFPMLAAASLGIILWDIATRRVLILWLVIVFTYSLMRYLVLWKYHKSNVTQDNMDVWLNLFIVIVCISGIIWGSAGIILIPYDDNIGTKFTLYNGITLLCVCGLVAGAVISYAVNLLVFFSYSFPALIPPAFYLISLGDQYNSALGGLILLYYIFIGVVAYRLNNQFMHYFDIEYQLEELKLKYLELNRRHDDLQKHIQQKYKSS